MKTSFSSLAKSTRIHTGSLILVGLIQRYTSARTKIRGKVLRRIFPLQRHLEELRLRATEAKQFGALFVNSHSGYDGWKEPDWYSIAALFLSEYQLIFVTKGLSFSLAPWRLKRSSAFLSRTKRTGGVSCSRLGTLRTLSNDSRRLN